MIRYCFLIFVIVACSKNSVDPNEHNPSKLADEELKMRLVGQWTRLTDAGFNQITLSSNQTASYTTNTTLGSQVYSNLTYRIQKEKKTVTIVFFRNGLERAKEVVSSISNTTWRNDVDNHTYEKK